jgi:hypothetical protein
MPMPKRLGGSPMPAAVEIASCLPSGDQAGSQCCMQPAFGSQLAMSRGAVPSAPATYTLASES